MVLVPCTHCIDPNGCAVRRSGKRALCVFCGRDLGEIRELPDIDDSLTLRQCEIQEQLEGKAVAHQAAARVRGYDVPLDIFRRDLAKRFNADASLALKWAVVVVWPESP